jgi:hypothetical protein
MKFFQYTKASIFEIIWYRLIKRLTSFILYYRDRVKFRVHYKKLKNLNGSAVGKNAFVFANGPSLNKLDPRKIKAHGFDIFAVNRYLLSSFGKIATPTTYILSDPIYFNEDENIKLTTKQLKLAEEVEPVKKILNENNITTFIPMGCLSKSSLKNKIGFCDIQNEFSKNVCNILKPRGYMSMTAYKALAIALYLGYDNIYICGFDNDNFKRINVNINNNMFYKDEHFYDLTGSTANIEFSDYADSVGDILYRWHFLFSDLSKFPSNNITVLDEESLCTFFSKKNSLNIFK